MNRIVGTICVNKDEIYTSNTNIAYQYADKIQLLVNFEDDYYSDTVLTFMYSQDLNKNKSAALTYDYENNLITLPQLQKSGKLYIQMYPLKDGIYNPTNVIDFYIGESVNIHGTNIPDLPTALQAAEQLMKQIYERDYKTFFDVMLNKFNEQNENVSILQKLINLAINSCGQYKFENGFLFFKQADGSYGEGINLNVSVEEFENVVRRVTSLETNGVQVTDTLPIGSTVLWDDRNQLPDAWEYVDYDICPKQLLINNDFQVNQRQKIIYTSNEYTLDMWYKHKNGSGTVGNVEKIDNGIRIVNEDYTNVFLNQKISNYYKGKSVTLVGKFNNVIGSAYLRISKATSIGINNVAYGNVEITEDGIFTTTVDIPLDGLDSYEYLKVQIAVKSNSSVEIEYIDMFEGAIAYPHQKEDYVLALAKCQEYLKVLVIYTIGLTKAWGTNRNSLLRWSSNFNIPFKTSPTISNIIYTAIYSDANESGHEIMPANIKMTNYVSTTPKSMFMISIEKKDGSSFDRSYDYFTNIQEPIVITCEPL